MESLFFKQIIISKDKIYRFQKKTQKDRKIVKNSWFDWLINYVLNPTKKLLAVLRTIGKFN